MNKDKIRELFKIAVEVEDAIEEQYPQSEASKQIQRIIREIKALDIG